jgi:TetR/AcrR family transcriptional regulator
MKNTIKEKRDESIRRILDAAMESFANLGFAGARIDNIAKKAGVNKAMIYYRIGDKKRLYQEVLHDIFGNAVEDIAKLIDQEESPEKNLRIYVRGILSIIKEHPLLPRFMMWEMASGAPHMSEIIIGDLARLIVILVSIFQEGIEEGKFIKINPILFHMMIVGTVIFNKVSEPIRENYQSSDIHINRLSPDVVKIADAEIEDLILRAVMR